ncbi:hypothetical protein V1264_000677 [Littorina saxatilis]|uniref:C2H2-type domain-containing protein n=1 Tax=Littorina saxatilis TaxID=31220 RepID=A0AAN9BZT7_9CAEN
MAKLKETGPMEERGNLVRNGGPMISSGGGKSDHSILTNGDSVMLDASTVFNVGIAPAEPDEGEEAPQPSLNDGNDVEEATDDVEFPEAVVLVGKTHWRCVSCMAYFSRTISIDEHVNVHHNLQAPPTVTRRGRGRGRGLARGRIVVQAVPEVDQKSQRSSRQAAEREGSGSGAREMADLGRLKLHRGKGRGFRRGRGGRGRGGRGKGRVFTKPLTSEDSDTEVDAPAPSPSLRTFKKRKPRNSVDTDKEEPVDITPEVCSKKPRKVDNVVNDLPALDEIPVDRPPPSPVPQSQETAKKVMKEKYVVVLGKTGAADCPSEFETHIDTDPPLPIEIPSLQADALLPPATPTLLDIHGPPKTPVLQDSLLLPETPQQVETTGTVDTHTLSSQESSHPHEFLSTGIPGILSVLAPETIVKPQSDFRSAYLVQNKHVDSDLGPMGCKTCGVVFDSVEELRSHIEEMVKFDIVSCNDCGDKFHGLHQLNIHVFNTHEKLARKFCFLCDADCLDGFELEEHLLEHTSSKTDHVGNTIDTFKHTCKTCGEEVDGKLSDLTTHYYTTHCQFVCIKCNELFADLTKYEEHMALHTSDTFHSDDPVVYSCPVSDCFQICTDKEALMDHISWHEDRDIEEDHMNLLYCCHCNDPFWTNIALERHLVETHNEADLKPFVCELCKEEFGHSLELRGHSILHHAGIKRYGCAYCDQRFAFPSAHRQHVASEHDVAATVLRM